MEQYEFIIESKQLIYSLYYNIQVYVLRIGLLVGQTLMTGVKFSPP